jgi:hypothetical protein
MAWLGAATGLAWSSHFEAVLLVPLFALAPLLGAPVPLRLFFVRMAGACLVAAAVFVIVNWPLFADLPGFIAGLQNGVQQASTGKDVVIRGPDYWFGFHLVNSLGPGMTWPALVLVLIGTLAALARFRRAHFDERWILAAALVFYLAVEIPPFKPWPDYAGYILPVAPFLLYLGVIGLSGAFSNASRSVTTAAVAVCASALVLYPLYDSARLVIGLADDSRTRAAGWLEANAGTALMERYAGAAPEDVRSVGSLEVAEFSELGVDYVLASSFMYDRFRTGSRLAGQDPAVYRAQARYEALFAHPFVEIAPAYRSMAYSNPTIRIVDVRAASQRRTHSADMRQPGH